MIGPPLSFNDQSQQQPPQSAVQQECEPDSQQAPQSVVQQADCAEGISAFEANDVVASANTAANIANTLRIV
jgi:hypothetical protein